MGVSSQPSWGRMEMFDIKTQPVSFSVGRKMGPFWASQCLGKQVLTIHCRRVWAGSIKSRDWWAHRFLPCMCNILIAPLLSLSSPFRQFVIWVRESYAKQLLCTPRFYCKILTEETFSPVFILFLFKKWHKIPSLPALCMTAALHKHPGLSLLPHAVMLGLWFCTAAHGRQVASQPGVGPGAFYCLHLLPCSQLLEKRWEVYSRTEKNGTGWDPAYL